MIMKLLRLTFHGKKSRSVSVSDLVLTVLCSTRFVYILFLDGSYYLSGFANELWRTYLHLGGTCLTCRVVWWGISWWMAWNCEFLIFLNLINCVILTKLYVMHLYYYLYVEMKCTVLRFISAAIAPVYVLQIIKCNSLYYLNACQEFLGFSFILIWMK